jgi:hypothetical protein
MPSTPGAPLFALTRFNACFRFSRSQTSSISRSLADGLSDSGFAAIGSAPRSPVLGASPLPPASRTRCVFCCVPMSSSPAYLPLLSVWAFGRRRPTMPAADSCTVVNVPCGPFSPDSRTPRRPPEVSSTAFTTHLPDLPPRSLMVVDFTIIGSLVRPGRPHIWFLFVRSWLCYALPSDPASRRRPCVSLVLHHHQAGQGTCTPKLLRMLGAPKKWPGKFPGHFLFRFRSQPGDHLPRPRAQHHP